MAEVVAKVASVVADYENGGVHSPEFPRVVYEHREALADLMELWMDEMSPDVAILRRYWFYNLADLSVMRDNVPVQGDCGRLTRQALEGAHGYSWGNEAQPTMLCMSIVSGLSLTPRFVLRTMLVADHMVCVRLCLIVVSGVFSARSRRA